MERKERTCKTRWFLVGTLAALTIAGCGGGGGGGSSTTRPAEGSTLPSTWHLSKINAASAHDNGLKGKQTTVAVLDTGLRGTHDEFEDRVHSATAKLEEYSYIDADGNLVEDVHVYSDPNDYEDVNGHGTHVASLAVGANMGVAPEAQVMGLKVIGDSGSGGTAGTAHSLDYARDNGASVYNMSSTTKLIAKDDPDYDYDIDAFRRVAAAEGAMVWAAGNESQDLTQEMNDELAAVAGSADPYHAFVKDADGAGYDGAKGHVLYAGAIDEDGNLASFSATPGSDTDMQNSYLLAPGVGVNGADNSADDEYTSKSGTSQAAPLVSGALATLMGDSEFLTGSEAVQILLDTADDSFSGYDPARHGQGLLDLEAALEPVGILSIPAGVSVSSLGAAVDQTAAQFGAAFGDALAGVEALDSVMAADAYHRDYYVDLGDAVAQPRDRMLERRMNRMWAGPQRTVRTMEGMSLRTRRAGSEDTQLGESPFRSVAMAYQAGRVRAALFTEADPTSLPGNDLAPRWDGLLSGSGMGLDGLGVREVAGGAVTVATGLDSAWRVNVWRGSGEEPWEGFGKPESYGVRAGWTRRLGDSGALELAWSQVRSEEVFPGAHATGALRLGDDARPLDLVSVRGRWDAGEDLQAFGGMRYGQTRPGAASTSILRDLSAGAVRSVYAGVAGQGADKGTLADWQLGAVYSQPLAVTDASATLDVPLARDFDGHLYRHQERVDLTPSGREQRLELYARGPAGDGHVATNLLYRHEPGHVGDAAPEVVATAGYEVAW